MSILSRHLTDKSWQRTLPGIPAAPTQAVQLNPSEFSMTLRGRGAFAASMTSYSWNLKRPARTVQPEGISLRILSGWETEGGERIRGGEKGERGARQDEP
jgi:hypothetical protein